MQIPKSPSHTYCVDTAALRPCIHLHVSFEATEDANDNAF